MDVAASAAEANLAITDDDVFLFAAGEWQKSFDKLGAHPLEVDGQKGYHFAVWCPGARSVSVVGTFNEWNVDANHLEPLRSSGIWCGFVPGASAGDLYKYRIITHNDQELYKADPYGFWAECPPGTASRLTDLDTYTWHDGLWMGRRARSDHFKRPLNIYEVHLGSWKRHDDGLDSFGFGEGFGSYLTYDELSQQLVDYVRDMNYTHIEIMPVMEHPFDGSWGYQITGYYAPTARYGSPDQFMHFVDACHQAGIGVILDWVPGGFCRNEEGLVHFNGEKLFELEEHPNWGTYKFDLGRGEVRSFLVSNAIYWLERYHADGMRLDGVTSMLYLNFGIDDPGQKKFNANGGEEDYNSIEFLRMVNSTVSALHPDVMMIAEESTAWPLVTYPPVDGGLGFHYKWDMGWMHDTLHYMQTDFPWRPGNHNLLTFSMMYAFNENFILSLSHDEVVHGKCSLITRMPGDWWRQFAGMRILAFYQITHPGGKLNFMGNEIAQFIEWRYYEGIQWFLASEYETHRDFQHFVGVLNGFYKEQKALWQKSFSWEGFEWIDADDAQESIISFVRHGERSVDDLVILINFDPAVHEHFRLGVPREGNYEEIFNTDSEEFGGSGVTNDAILVSHPEPASGRDDSILVRVPPLAGIVLRRVGKSSYVPPKPKPGTEEGRKERQRTIARAKGQAQAKKPVAPVVPTRKGQTTKGA